LPFLAKQENGSLVLYFSEDCQESSIEVWIYARLKESTNAPRRIKTAGLSESASLSGGEDPRTQPKKFVKFLHWERALGSALSREIRRLRLYSGAGKPSHPD
jgi:hypothetical protein